MKKNNVLLDMEMCTGCGACYSACPKGAIKMVYNNEGFLYPSIDFDLCIDCRKCEDVCPVCSKREINGIKNVDALVAKSKVIEKNSASGGVFAILARYVLGKGGVVFGAAYNESFQVVHTFITDESDLIKLQGSKYVQSKIGNVYKYVEKFLKKNRTVLFSGTSCQIEGLRNFLNESYENLICVDIVCHGVPSPGVWEKYLRVFHKKRRIEKINFRKESDSEKKEFYIKFLNGLEYRRMYPNDPYIWGFCYDLFLRKSCYDCKFKGVKRNSDILLGDAWGMRKYVPQIFGRRGKNSIIILQTEKGRKIFNEICDRLVFEALDVDCVVRENRMIIESAQINRNRDKFFEELHKNSFRSVLVKYYIKGKVFQEW